MIRENTGEADRIRSRLAQLPKGNITFKTIRGSRRMYLQWSEEGRRRSRYVRAADEEMVRAQIRERAVLESRLRSLETGAVEYEWHQVPYAAVAEEHFGYETRQNSSASEAVEQAGAPAFGQTVRWLKWGDEVIGEVDESFAVRFTRPELNRVVRSCTEGRDRWSRQEFTHFLEERIVSSSRRDIEKILRRCGLKEYDPLQIALFTRGISARDMLWIAESEEERFEDAITEVFTSVFLHHRDLQGDSVDTPEGQNVKRYGVFRGRYGIYKQRLSPVMTDVESELAVAALAQRLEIPCCPCFRVDEDTVFSEFCYDFTREHIIHFRQLIPAGRRDNELYALLSARPQYTADLARMVALDFLTRQDDRHLSNIAVKVRAEEESFYPLYDNGRSLFYEDTEETVRRACEDIPGFATAFGPYGSYYDHVVTLSEMGISFRKLLHLEIGDEEIRSILLESGFTGYRLEGGIGWICRCLDILRGLG